MTPCLRVFGLDSSLELRFTGPGAESLVETATRAWSRCLSGTAASREAEGIEVSAPSDITDLGRVMQMLTQQVTQRLIRSQAGRLLMLHAGAVSHPCTGKSLVFAAPGGTGKTTLARVLAQHYGYLTDETVGVDSSGRIAPYQKPLSLRQPDGGPKHEMSPDEIGLITAHPEPKMARLVVLNRPRGHNGPPQLDELDTLDAIESILPETSSLGQLPRPLHRLRELTEQYGPVLRCSYSEAHHLVEVAADLIGGTNV